MEKISIFGNLMVSEEFNSLVKWPEIWWNTSWWDLFVSALQTVFFRSALSAPTHFALSAQRSSQFFKIAQRSRTPPGPPFHECKIITILEAKKKEMTKAAQIVFCRLVYSLARSPHTYVHSTTWCHHEWSVCRPRNSSLTHCQYDF